VIHIYDISSNALLIMFVYRHVLSCGGAVWGTRKARTASFAAGTSSLHCVQMRGPNQSNVVTDRLENVGVLRQVCHEIDRSNGNGRIWNALSNTIYILQIFATTRVLSGSTS
jgi:hypothetical protein